MAGSRKMMRLNLSPRTIKMIPSSQMRTKKRRMKKRKRNNCIHPSNPRLSKPATVL